MDNILYGYCHCGCGQETAVNTRNDTGKGWVKGEPRRFISGHNMPSKPLSPVQYKVEDRGHDTPCWVWQRSLRSDGAGQLTAKGGHWIAHRYFYLQRHGHLPEGLVLDHLCRVRACVNPEHLEPVTHVENLRRGKHIKLSKEKARAIRAARGKVLARNLAKQHGVAVKTIYNLWFNRKNRSWEAP